MYRFRVKILYAGKLRIFTVTAEGDCDAIHLIGVIEEVLGVGSLSVTQIVSIERIEDEP